MKENILLVMLLFCGMATSQVKLDPNAVGIDEGKSLIIVSCDIAQLNKDFPEAKKSIEVAGQTYSLKEEKAILRKGEFVEAQRGKRSYKLVFTELPMVKLNVPKEIRDTPKTSGNILIMENGQVKIRSFIGIEYRGASTQAFPKKSMEFEFWTDQKGTDDQKFAPLGLHNSDSFNLQALYNETLRLNSKVANELWLEMYPNVPYQTREPAANSGSRMYFVDLFLNGQYRGIYGLAEKVNRKTLKLKKEKDGKIEGELYKGKHWGVATFTDIGEYDNKVREWKGTEYKYPKDVTDWQYLYNLVDFVMNSSEPDFVKQYGNWFEADNALDYFIFLNVLRAGDNTGKNIYTAKYKQGEKYFFIPWDLDGVFGTIWDGSNQDNTGDILVNGLYTKLLKDPGFRKQLAFRWWELKEMGVLTPQHISALFESNMSRLIDNGAYEREQFAWKNFTFSQDQWSYQKDWINRRMQFLDHEFSTEKMGVSKKEVRKFKKELNKKIDRQRKTKAN